jgi:ABC-2 type transport system permease protein
VKPRIIAADFIASLRAWGRSKGTLFWTIAFPVMLILIFGAIFSGSDDQEFQLHVQDVDGSSWSVTFIDILRNISVLDIQIIDGDVTNITQYIKEHDIIGALVIPSGFGDAINRSFVDETAAVNISFYYDPAESSASILQNVVASGLQEFNMHLTGGRHVIGVDSVSTLGEEFGFMDYFVPGMIGFSIMQLCVYGSIERNTKFRKDGVLRKLFTTPITRAEWIFAKMLFMLFLSFVSTIVIVIVGTLVWGLTIHFNFQMLVIIVANSFLFSGLGMIIARFVKEEETADMAGGAITFPMMFLAGTFWPLDQLDPLLQLIAQVFPLYYVNEGLRNAMIYLDFDKAFFHMMIVLLFAVIFFVVGVLLTKWKED